MNHYMRSAIALIALLPVLGCGGGKSHESGTPTAADLAYEESAVPGSEAAVSKSFPLPPAERKIIRTGDLRFDVDDLEAARTAIIERVSSAGGYVEGDDRGDWGHQHTVTLRVRVPADRFDPFVQGLQGLGRLEQQSISAADVTSEWVDVEARLVAKRAVEKRYLELAGQARNVSEMLEVERELGNVRMEIESMEARMKALRDQVAMSTLTITCVKEQAMTERFTPRFGVALGEGWNNLLRFLVGLTHLWPFVILFGVLVWWWRRRRSKRAKRA